MTSKQARAFFESQRPKAKRMLPAPVLPVSVPLPRVFYGQMCVIEGIAKSFFVLQCESETGELVTYSLDEDELRKVLKDFNFPAIPRIVSAAKYSRRIQVIPHLHDGAQEQIISLYPATNVPMLDFRDGADYESMHEMT